MDKSIISTQDAPNSPSKQDRTIYVYYNPKPTIRVTLKFLKDEIGDITLSDLIGKSIKILSEDYLIPLNMSKSAYCFFPANKTGSKRDGYPQLDTKLSIYKVNMKKLYLEQINKAFSLISTEFNLERKYGLQKKVKESGMCCQLFKLLKV